MKQPYSSSGSELGQGGYPVQILLVEDSPGDVALTMEALADARIANDLHVTNDGDEALAFLRRSGPFADAPRPDVILLDLNLPRKDGREVLEELKADDELSTIPVIVLTTSTSEADVLRSYELQASAYISKPVDFLEFMSVVRSFEGFWLQVVRYPGPR